MGVWGLRPQRVQGRALAFLGEWITARVGIRPHYPAADEEPMRDPMTCPAFLVAAAVLVAGGAAGLPMLAATLPSSNPVHSIFAFRAPDTPHPTGTIPWGNLLLGADGSLYGTASDYQVAFGQQGHVFRLTPATSGTGAWHETVLHRFVGKTDGKLPFVGVVAGADGALYGTTYVGGAHGGGTAYRLAPPAGGGKAWSFSVLHAFDKLDGAIPLSPLLPGPDGSFYGTTNGGGDPVCLCGTIFQLLPPRPRSPTGSTGWTERVLYKFTDSAIGNPAGSLIADPAGALYGVTGWFGPPDIGYQNLSGIVYQLVPPVSRRGAWTLNVLHQFAGGSDGDTLEAGVVRDPDGNLYGTAALGGASNAGIAFRLSPPAGGSGTWAETILHNFAALPRAADGAYPAGDLLLLADGSLLGTASEGGGQVDDNGTVFALSPPAPGSGTWSFTTLAALTSLTGNSPFGGLTQDGQGNFAGTATEGARGFGSVYLYRP